MHLMHRDGRCCPVSVNLVRSGQLSHSIWPAELLQTVVVSVNVVRVCLTGYGVQFRAQRACAFAFCPVSRRGVTGGRPRPREPRGQPMLWLCA